MRDTQKERARQRHRPREKQTPCRDPDMGPHPMSPGSRPGPKAALNHWATGAALFSVFCEDTCHAGLRAHCTSVWPHLHLTHCTCKEPTSKQDPTEALHGGVRTSMHLFEDTIQPVTLAKAI